MTGRYTILIENRITQTSPVSRKPLQNARFGINADSSGIKEMVLSINPLTTVSIPSSAVYFNMVSSDVLQVTLHSINTVNNQAQTTVLNVQRIFDIASPLTGVDIYNASTLNVVECTIIYS